MAEWNVVEYSYLLSKNRIDSEFYKSEYVELEKYLKGACRNIKLREHVKIIEERFTKSCSDELFQYNDIGNTDLNNGYIEKNLIRKRNAPGRATFINKTDDILISTVRPNRNANAIVNRSDYLQVGSNGFCNVRSRGLNPNYIFIYTKTSAFIKSLMRATTTSMYPSVSDSDILNSYFFLPSPRIINTIGESMESAREKIINSKALILQAEELLIKELGLDVLERDERFFTEVSLSETMTLRRFDSQCFKPEYVQYEKAIREMESVSTLWQVVTSFTKGHQETPNGNGSINYVSIKDIHGLELITSTYCSSSQSTRIADKNDLLLAITGATIGKIGINNRYERLAHSGDLLAIKTNKLINPFYLLIVLQSQIGQTQIYRWITGATNGHLSPSDVRKILIPRLPRELESRIIELVNECFKNRFESEALLDNAKRMVEKLIEEASV